MDLSARPPDLFAAPGGTPEADWLATPFAFRELILAQREELLAQRKEIEQLRSQVSSMATELANLRERTGHGSRNSSKPPSSNGPGAIRPSGDRAVAASVVASPGTPAKGLSRCQWSGWMKWWSILPMPAVVGARCWMERIQNLCGNK